MDTALWKRYRDRVPHPTTVFKPQDLDTARRNLQQHAWAREVLKSHREHLEKLPAFVTADLERMIPRETPGSALFTMCPACEAAPVHGHYHWSPEDPDHLVCTTCKTVYPNADYPETVVLETDFGGGQRITFYGGKSWDLINFPFVSSWTANIRARKCTFMGQTARQLATVYALTGDLDSAEKVRAILLRFAAVYPGFMVHSGYGEFSDLDPETASKNILDLPKPELVVPPNRPNNALHVGYWMAGRATGVGMEGRFISDVAVAYDLTCEAEAKGRPVYSGEDRRTIERDLLLEGTILLRADPGFNNKSATNRSAAGLVGMCVGDPELVRFGLEGFRHFVHGWYLRDGQTSESPAYGFMTLNGILDFGDALHGYTDPEGYSGSDGRLDDLDIYGDSRYRAVFDGFFKTQNPDLRYPVIADSNTTTRMPNDVVEAMAARYDDPQYRALLVERCEGDLEAHGEEYALFHRNPDLVPDPREIVRLPDAFFPDLRIGFLRTGADGRKSTVLLSASDWGGHHHLDSLNLTYWKDGREALTDLGYLWDRPDKRMTVRTMAHNTVLVDGEDQKRQERGGSLHAFDRTGPVKLVEVSSRAYDTASVYRRLAMVVDHGDGASYLVDLFRVHGGRVHDYLFHGPVEKGDLQGLALHPSESGWQDLKNVREVASSEAPWTLAFDLDEDRRFTAFALPEGPERVLLGDGWGERGTGSRDHVLTGETVPYLVRQRSGDPADSAFLSLFDVGLRENPFVQRADRLRPTDGDGTGLAVATSQGLDIAAFCPDGRPAAFETPRGVLETDGIACVVSFTTEGRLAFFYLLGGTRATLDGHAVELAEPALRGNVLDSFTTADESGYVLDGDGPADDAVGRTLVVDVGDFVTGFPILRVRPEGKTCRVYTKLDRLGYDAIEARTWLVHRSVCRKA